MQRAEHRAPTDAQIEDLHAACKDNFEPCTCHVMTGFGNYRVCKAHAWLTERDKRSVEITRWERLLFVRAMRARFEAQEFGPRTPTATPVDPTGVLPW